MEGVKYAIRDPQSLKFKLKKNKKDIIFWIIAVIITFFILTLAGFNSSVFLTLSSLIQTLGFIIILLKVRNSQNCSGLSINTLRSYQFLLIGRLFATVFLPGYCPEDITGDFLYQLFDFTSLIIVFILIHYINSTFKETSDITLDSVNYYYLVIPCVFLGLLVHTSLNNFPISDIAWSFSMYLEGIAIFPQLKLFIMKKGQIETYTSHWVALCGLSRFFCLIFWLQTFPELNSSEFTSYSLFSGFTGYFIIISQILQLIIMADFYYLYFKSWLKGEKMNVLNI